MSFLQPTEAPRLHIELLPSHAIAVQVVSKHLTTKTYDGPSIHIATWAPGSDMPCVSEESTEEFCENTCEDCEYHTDELEVNANNDEYLTYVNGDEVRISGTFYTDSPCPCYRDGIDSVYFPCYAGKEPCTEGSGQELSTQAMRYDHVFRDSTYFSSHDTLALQQRIGFLEADEEEDEPGYYTTDSLPAINCFDNNSICWGSNEGGNSLLQIESIYTSSEANEDLLSYSAHESNFDEIEGAELEDYCSDVIGLSEYDHRGTAVIVASARTMPAAYLLLGSSGAKLGPGLAFITALLYKNVAVDDDHILNVWATDVLPTGNRLLFLHQYSDEYEFNCIFLGQVPSDFNLEPCESLPAQSSELAEPVSN